MPATLRTRKAVTALTVTDLRAFPIWEFCTDEEHIPGHDETFVRPLPRKTVPMNRYSLLVAAVFTTTAGRSFEGFMVVTTAEKRVEVRPGAVLEEGYLVLPTVSRETALREKYDWSLRDRQRLSQALGVMETELFPLHYRLRAIVAEDQTICEGQIV